MSERATELRFDGHRPFSLRASRGACIRVLEGLLWITEDGLAADHFVHAGGEYRIAGDGLVVIEPAGRAGAARIMVASGCAAP